MALRAFFYLLHLARVALRSLISVTILAKSSCFHLRFEELVRARCKLFLWILLLKKTRRVVLGGNLCCSRYLSAIHRRLMLRDDRQVRVLSKVVANPGLIVFRAKRLLGSTRDSSPLSI